MFKDNCNTILAPTQFLMDSTTNNDWNFSTASSFYLNESAKLSSKESETINTPPSPKSISPKINERKHLLEKNRQAAYRCRQKKKKWVQELEERSDTSERVNKELQEQVAQLRNESIYLRNLLLTHGNCQCDVVQDYLRRTSAQLSGQMDSMLDPKYL